MQRFVAHLIGKPLLKAARLRGSGGSALPGLVVEKITPNYLAKSAAKLPLGSIIITGTNGKTTTTKMLRGILESEGKTVITNRAGSNMSRGIVSTLLEHSKVVGKLRGDIGVFEVDEAWVPQISKSIKPRVIVVLNLLRDQLDRYGELDSTAKLIGAGLEHAQHVILNADDPLVADLAKYCPQARVHYFGATPKLQNLLPDDANLFTTRRPGQTHKKIEPESLSVLLRAARSTGSGQVLELAVSKQLFRCKLPLDGIYNAYNAAAALAAARALEVPAEAATNALARVKPAFGRSELVEVEERQLQILLVKNPSGFNQIIKTFLLKEPGQRVLMAVNDKIADGRDVSWLWDVNFEPLASKQHRILTSGLRGLDLSLRLKYAEVKSSNEPKLAKALKEFVSSIPKGGKGYIVPTYTAMLELRRLMGKSTELDEVWE